MVTASTWKNDGSGLRALRDLARDVGDRSDARDARMSARTAAQALFGAVGLASARHGVDAMQKACADLVRSEAAWATKFGTLPRDHTGRVSEELSLIACMARGLLPLAGADRLRAALAFWATEDDPAMWRQMVPND
jgi:hypothetical protein